MTKEQLAARSENIDVLDAARRAKQAAGKLAALSAEKRNQILIACTEELRSAETDILTANERDLKDAHAAQDKGELSASLLGRLKLDSAKLRTVIDGIEQIAAMPDPLGRTILARELDEGLELFQVTCPIGVIGVIFESRPDALPQITSLCLKAGNAAILKGGKEAACTNRSLFECFKRALHKSNVDPAAIALFESREAIASLLTADKYVDLIVPRGSNALVRHIQDNTRIPVLGHADGICHVYVDQNADLQMATDIVVDAKTQYPSACNAVETVLLHKDRASELLKQLVPRLVQSSVDVRCDQGTLDALPQSLRTSVSSAANADWCTEYCDLIVSIKTVDSLDEAIEHINEFGSHHTDCIITNERSRFEEFFARVDSAGVYWNASTRFADGFRYGFGAEVGISTGKLHPRGPVGLDGLVTYKYKLMGKGQVVAEYAGDSGKHFTHRDISKQ